MPSHSWDRKPQNFVGSTAFFEPPTFYLCCEMAKSRPNRNFFLEAIISAFWVREVEYSLSLGFGLLDLRNTKDMVRCESPIPAPIWSAWLPHVGAQGRESCDVLGIF